VIFNKNLTTRTSLAEKGDIKMLTEEQIKECKELELNELKKKGVASVVLYDKQGEPVDVYAVPPCKVKARGKQVTTEFIRDIIAKHKKANVKSQTVIHVSGSPDCIIYIFGIPICICCY
jgi:hypothetical protein